MVNLNLGFWTEEKIAHLKKLVDEGLSFRKIAPIIGATRNACIGKAGRLHFTKVPAKPKVKPKSKAAKPKPEKAIVPVTLPVTVEAKSTLPRTNFTAKKKVLRVRLPVELSDDESFWGRVGSLTPRSSSITDIPNAFSCKYISGDVREGTAKWCGAPAIAGKSWCKDHLKRVYAPPSAYGRLKPPSVIMKEKERQ